MAFILYREYQLEKLAQRFVSDIYNRAPADNNLLKPCEVIVQTRGMAEYLRQATARGSKIAANLNTYFLNSFTDRIFRTLYPEQYRAGALRSDQLNMRKNLLRLLGDQKFIEQSAPQLKKYIGNPNCHLKRWQLAGKLADLFDQYQLYRGDELYAGTLFAPDSWQGTLYNKLFNAETPGRDHFFRMLKMQGLTEQQAGGLPREITVFGVGAMPPVYLEIFVKLAEYTRVNFFYLTPCLEYWSDQYSYAERKHLPWSVENTGNPILQALGRQGRSFFSALMAQDHVASELIGEAMLPDESAGNTMLEIMQHDILGMFDRRAAAVDEDTTLIGTPRSDLKNDGSIAVHSCHSLRRELEVLHDELIKLIRSGTAPQDIIVMAPDIAKAAPLIDAIFGNGPLKNVYSIADLPDAEYQHAFEAFHRILKTAAGRFEYTELMSLLDMPFISMALKLTDEDLSNISSMLAEGGARWGFSGAMHARFCGGDFEEYTFRSAIDRLLTGFICRQNKDDSMLINGTVPLEKLGNSTIAPFCRTVRFLEKLADLADELQSPALLQAPVSKTLAQWQHIFCGIADNFFGQDNLQRTALAPLRSALAELENMAEENCLTEPCQLNAALAILDDLWVLPENSGSFLRGKITFCRMVPMRSIPMDTVAVLEMNEGAFPRRNTEIGFDLIAASPRPGDRQIAVQDRYLLLEALMAARKNLLFFYQGRNSRTNEKLHACAPLKEIMTYLKNAFLLEEYEHKISGIAAEYYRKDAPYPSLDMDNYQALLQSNKTAVAENAEPSPLQLPGLDCSAPLQLKSLCSFFGNHCQWAVRNKLGIYFSRQDEFSNDEPWTPSHKDLHKLDSVIARFGGRMDEDDLFIHAGSCNVLPPGKVGRVFFEERCNAVMNVPPLWKNLLQIQERRYIACQIKGKFGNTDVCTVSGMVNMTPDGRTILVNAQSGYKAAHALEALFGALIQAAGSSESCGAEILNLSGGKYEEHFIEPVSPEAAAAMLTELLELAAQEQPYPLPLFPTASVYYNDLKKAEKKYYTRNYDSISHKYNIYGDVTDENIRRFYTLEQWQDQDFQLQFRQYGQMLYSLLQLRQEDQE